MIRENGFFYLLLSIYLYILANRYYIIVNIFFTLFFFFYIIFFFFSYFISIRKISLYLLIKQITFIIIKELINIIG